MRVGRITASISHDILHTKFENPSKSLITRICTNSSSITIPAVPWDVENESTCRIRKSFEQFIKNYITNHKRNAHCLNEKTEIIYFKQNGLLKQKS